MTKRLWCVRNCPSDDKIRLPLSATGATLAQKLLFEHEWVPRGEEILCPRCVREEELSVQEDELRAKRLALVDGLDPELRRRGMKEERRMLGRYREHLESGLEPGIASWEWKRWRRYKTLPPEVAARAADWSHADVIQLARTLRVPPHDKDLQVRPFGSGCGCASPKNYEALTFPGGRRKRCDSCQFDWLELEDPS